MELALFYAEMLHRGFLVMRQALDSANQDWIDLEFELLHNVPGLIGEPNIERHLYFWFQERTLYIEQVSAPGLEQAKSRMLTYYKLLWDEMEPFFTQLATPSPP